MGDIRRIMVLAMEIRDSGQAVRQGALLARKFDAGLFVLHVEHNPFGEQGWNLPFLALDNAYLELIKSDKKALAELLRTVEAGGLPVRKIIVRDEPLSAIREAIARERIDLLIVPSHEESRFEHFLIGHLNEDLLRTLPCSILFVKDETAA